jgi:AAA+ superfamily predicted ATPase
MSTNGIHASHKLPHPPFASLWDAIHVSSELKDKLLSQAILNFTARPYLDRARVPLHGIILMTGVPGTGKTSLAKGLADRIGQVLNGEKLHYLEVEPHSLQSAQHGQSQKAVKELFATTIAERAALGPTFVLLDEVETLVVDRSRLSMDANPIDVHRATDAALVQLDQLSETYKNLIFVATSNFPAAIDSAFRSRCDLVIEVPLPNEDAIRSIMADAVGAFGQHFPKVNSIGKGPDFEAAVRAAVGLDGRQVRKAVASAFTFDRQVALDPNKVTAAALLQAVKHAKRKDSK